MNNKKVVEVTLPDSGVTLRIKRIGPLLANDIRRRLKSKLTKPQPPLQEVMIGDEKRMERNEANPTYIQELGEYNGQLGLMYLEELVRYGIVNDLDVNGELKSEIAELRAMDDEGMLPKDDFVLYVTRCALISKADMQSLQQSILGMFQPTEKAVAAATDNFQR